MYVGSNLPGPRGASQTVGCIGAGGFEVLVPAGSRVQCCHGGDLDPSAASSRRLVFRYPQPIDGVAWWVRNLSHPGSRGR